MINFTLFLGSGLLTIILLVMNTADNVKRGLLKSSNVLYPFCICHRSDHIELFIDPDVCSHKIYPTCGGSNSLLLQLLSMPHNECMLCLKSLKSYHR